MSCLALPSQSTQDVVTMLNPVENRLIYVENVIYTNVMDSDVVLKR